MTRQRCMTRINCLESTLSSQHSAFRIQDRAAQYRFFKQCKRRFARKNERYAAHVHPFSSRGQNHRTKRKGTTESLDNRAPQWRDVVSSAPKRVVRFQPAVASVTSDIIRRYSLTKFSAFSSQRICIIFVMLSK